MSLLLIVPFRVKMHQFISQFDQEGGILIRIVPLIESLQTLRTNYSIIFFQYTEGRNQRWSGNFVPVVKVDRLKKETIPDEEAKEPFC